MLTATQIKAVQDSLAAGLREGLKGLVNAPQGGDSAGGRIAQGAPGLLRSVVAEDAKDSGQVVGRYLQCLLAAGRAKRSDVMDVFNEHYKGDKKTEKALSASDFSAGGAMVGTETAREIIELLRPATVVRQARPRIAQMTTGSLDIPRHTAGSTGSYVGENQTGGSSQATTGDLNLTRKKLKVEIPFSNDFTRFAVINGDEFIRADAVDGLATREDAAFIRDDGTVFTPRGMRYWVPSAHVFDASSDTDDLPSIELRVRQAIAALKSANVMLTNAWWFMSVRTEMRLKTARTGGSADGEYAFRPEMLQGRFWGYQYAVSTQIPEDLGGGTESELYFVNMPDMVIGEALELTLDVFPGGAYHDGTAVRSGISRDQTVLRAIMQHDFGARHPESIAVVSGVKWGV